MIRRASSSEGRATQGDSGPNGSVGSNFTGIGAGLAQADKVIPTINAGQHFVIFISIATADSVHRTRNVRNGSQADAPLPLREKVPPEGADEG